MIIQVTLFGYSETEDLIHSLSKTSMKQWLFVYVYRVRETYLATTLINSPLLPLQIPLHILFVFLKGLGKDMFTAAIR